MKFTRHRAILIAFALGAVRGCGGGTQDGALPAQPGFARSKCEEPAGYLQNRRAENTGVANARRPQYVSPATTQMAIDVQTGCPGGCVSVAPFPRLWR
ncbi:MAG: hypothetical protein ACXVAW_01420 [Vulcanimicrobiaceae bacterium]